MASTIIHITVGKRIGQIIGKTSKEYYLGTIAPDLSKIIKESRKVSHFMDSLDDLCPNIDRFLLKYQQKLNDDFVLGYYIHLYTDYLWYKYFIPEILDSGKQIITKIDGTIVQSSDINNLYKEFIYNDYTNLNEQLIKNYELDLSFLDITTIMPDIIDEINESKLDLLLIKTKEIIENSKRNKEYIFNMENIDNFINMCEKLIIANLKEVYL